MIERIVITTKRMTLSRTILGLLLLLGARVANSEEEMAADKSAGKKNTQRLDSFGKLCLFFPSSVFSYSAQTTRKKEAKSSF